MEKIVFIDYQVEAPYRAVKGLIEISHEEYFSSCIVMTREEHVEVF